MLKMHSLILGFLFIFLFQVLGFSLLIVLRSIGAGNGLLFEQIAFLTLAIFCLICIFEAFKRKFGTKKDFFDFQIQLTAIASLLFFLLAQFSILNIDRSRSFYVLSWIHLERVEIKGGNYDLNKVESDEKSNLNAIVDRIKEQETRGLAIVKNSKLQLTPRGKIVLWIAEASGDLFHLEYWAANRK